MKKLIALALALVMVLSMGSVAFAAECSESAQCTTAGVENDPDYSCEADVENGEIHLLPGEGYWLMDLEENGLLTIESAPHIGLGEDDSIVPVYNGDDEDNAQWFPGDAEDFKVSCDWDVGGALVKAVYWDDDEDDLNEDGAWVLALNENYTITSPKTLRGTIEFTGKGDNNEDDDYDFEVYIDTVVCNHSVLIEGEEDIDDAEDYPIEAYENTIYECDEDSAGYVVFNDGRLLGVTLDMESEEKVYLHNDEDLIEDLADAFPDADIECYNFGSVRTLANEAQLSLQADYAEQYFVYTYANGKLEAQDYEWNSIDGVYEWESKTLGTYVISDVELVASADADAEADAEEATKNPDTGANDVVGVAAALAVVSLVAGAAVSLKK